MNAAKRKLQSRRGASMLMALLLMLVALMVSAVVLSAAITAAVDVRNQKASQQAYLTASSAAQLFRDSVLDKAGAYTLTTITTYTKENATDTNWEKTSESANITASPSGPYATIMKDALETVIRTKTAFKGVYRIEASGYDSVDLHLSLNPIYGDSQDITKLTGVELLAAFSTNVSGHPCQVSLTMTASLDSTFSTNELSKTKTETLSTFPTWDSNNAILSTPKTATEATP